MFDSVTGPQDAASRYQAAWEDLAASSRRQAAELQETVAASLRAAQGGDDTAERSARSWAAFQRGLTRLNIDYYASCKRLRREYLAAVDALEEEVLNERFEDAAKQLTTFFDKGGAAASGGEKKSASSDS